jgi:hypothetical protein
MNSASLQVIRLRALEEADPHGEQLSLQLRREATEQTEKSAHFLFQRTQYLAQQLPELQRVEPSLPRWVYVVLLLGALALGYTLTELGQERIINLLALPLILVLAWNGVMLCWGLWHELRRPKPLSQPSAAKVVEAWQKEKRHSTVRRLFHLAAAVLALGTIVGLYSKGWAREYRAVWESTLLDEGAAQRFFSTLYKPAAVLLNLPVPLEQVPSMRLRPEQPQSVLPAPALPWIHLYAGTLFLAVIIPRLLLAGLNLQRSRMRQRQLWRSLDWPNYEAKLRRSSRRHTNTAGVARVCLLAHQCGTEAAVNEERLSLLSEHLSQSLVPEFHTLTPGEEEAFLQAWQPSSSVVVLLFNAATTPEKEVHDLLVQQVREKLQQSFADSQFRVMLDLRSLLARRDIAAAEQRLQLWKETLGDAVEILVVR